MLAAQSVWQQVVPADPRGRGARDPSLTRRGCGGLHTPLHRHRRYHPDCRLGFVVSTAPAGLCSVHASRMSAAADPVAAASATPHMSLAPASADAADAAADAADVDPPYVWYASFGSNILWERFACYLAGGRVAGMIKDMPGSRDPSPPTRSTAWSGKDLVDSPLLIAT